MAKTLQQIKDEVANDNGWTTWESATPPWVEAREVERLMNEVAKRYAQEQKRELMDMLEITHQMCIKRQFPSENELKEMAKEIEQLIKSSNEG